MDNPRELNESIHIPRAFFLTRCKGIKTIARDQVISGLIKKNNSIKLYDRLL